MSSILTPQNKISIICNYENPGYLPSTKYLPKDETFSNTEITFEPVLENTILYSNSPDLIFFQDDEDIRWEIEHNLNSLCNNLEFYFIDAETTTEIQYGIIKTVENSSVGTILYFQPIESKNNICILSLEKLSNNYFYSLNINKKSIYGFSFYYSLLNLNISSNINWLSTTTKDEQTFKCGQNLLNRNINIKDVEFSTAFSDTNYLIFTTNVTENIENYYFSLIKEKSTTGFKIKFSNNILNDNNYLNWYAVSLNDTVLNSQKGLVEISSGVSSVKVILDEVIYDDYLVFCSMENSVDDEMFLYQVGEKTSTDFTITFSSNTLTANYKLNWMVIPALDSSKFNQTYYKFFPKDIELIDENNAKAYFTKPTSGIVNIKKLGNIFDETAKYPAPYGEHNIFSPHYKVELDINKEPLVPLEHTIISYSLEKSLYEEWEKFRPESRVAHYQILFKIFQGFKYGEINSFTHYSDSIYTNWKHQSLLSYSNAPGVKIFSNILNASSQWELYHNFGTTSLIIQTYSDNLAFMLPKNIFHENKNTVFVNFEHEQKGYAFFVEADYDKTFYITSPDETLTYEHNLATDNLIFQLDEKFINKEGIPYNLQTIDNNKVSFTFDTQDDKLKEPLYGNILILHGDHVFYQNDESKQWIIEHNSGYLTHIIQCFDENGNEILPRYVDFISDELLTVTFGNEVKGRIVLKYISSNPKYSEGVFLEKAKKQKLVLKVGSEKQNLSTINTIGKINNLLITQTVSSLIEEKDYFIVNFEIPIAENYEIKQFGLYDSEEIGTHLYYYSYGDLIYKLQGMNLMVSYKILRGQ